jgi:hypothetical protein
MREMRGKAGSAGFYPAEAVACPKVKKSPDIGVST